MFCEGVREYANGFVALLPLRMGVGAEGVEREAAGLRGWWLASNGCARCELVHGKVHSRGVSSAAKRGAQEDIEKDLGSMQSAPEKLAVLVFVDFNFADKLNYCCFERPERAPRCGRCALSRDSEPRS